MGRVRKSVLGSILFGAPFLALNWSSAVAAPATMLIVLRSETNPVTTVQFPSLADCDAAADHLAQVRTPNESTLGIAGAWKANFRYGREGFRQEPRIAMVCLPATAEIPQVVEVLTEKGWYRDLYAKDKEDESTSERSRIPSRLSDR